jgi:hypothetical protein
VPQSDVFSPCATTKRSAAVQKTPLLSTCCDLIVCRSRLPKFSIQGYPDFLARRTCGQARKQLLTSTLASSH